MAIRRLQRNALAILLHMPVDRVRIEIRQSVKMAVDPQSGLVLAVTNMENPENNAVAKKILIHAVSKGHQIDCIVYDRMCACYQQFGREAVLKQIKFWCVDRFHAQAHAPGCACSPLVHKRLDRRLENVNTSAAEQTFAWFRNYASVLNTKATESHIFHVLVYVKRHNDLIRRNYKKHLNAYSAMKKVARVNRVLRKPASKKYVCRRPSASFHMTIKSKKNVMKVHLKSKAMKK